MKKWINIIFILFVVCLYNAFNKDSFEKKAELKRLEIQAREADAKSRKNVKQVSRIIANTKPSEVSAEEFKFDEKNMITKATKGNFQKELFYCKARMSDCEFFTDIKDHAGRVHKLKFCEYYAKNVLKKQDALNYCNNIDYRDPVIKELREAYAEQYKDESRVCFTLSKFCDEDEHMYPITEEEAEQLSILEFNGTVKYLF